MKRFTEIKSKAQDIAEEIKQSLNEEVDKTDNKSRSNKKFYQRQSSSPEEVVGTVWSWFVILWFGIIVTLFGIILALSNSRFWLFAILLIIGLPFLVLYCVFMMIPEIKIFGFTIFSRHKFGVKNSVSIGSRFTYTLSKEFFRQNPSLAFVILILLVLIFVSLFSAII